MGWSFDGTGDYLDYLVSPITPANNPYSIFCYNKAAGLSGTHTSFMYGLAGNTANGAWLRKTSSDATLQHESVSVTTSVAPVIGDWDFQLGTRSGANGVHYYNNETPATSAGLTSMSASTDTCWIGGRDDSPFDYFDGVVAECAIWNVTLTAADFDVLAAGYSPLFVQSDALVFYAPLANNNIDIIGGLAPIVNGNAAQSNDHPPVIFPSAQTVRTVAAAVASRVTLTGASAMAMYLDNRFGVETA